MDLNPLDFVIYGLPLLLAIPLHEAAHGFVADRCGDSTARRLGRVTFNPLKHIDPLGTVIFPVLLILAQAPFIFGWAKPVPVDFGRLRHLRRDMVLVAAAGPGINLLLALLSGVALRFATVDMLGVPLDQMPWYAQMFFFSLLLNVMLAVFNLIPLLPLDGGRIIAGLLPSRMAIPYSRTEKFGFPLIIFLLLLLPMLGSYFGQNWNLFHLLVLPPVYAISDSIMTLVGIQ